MEKKIVVFGSFVVDLAGKTEVLPLPGQTVMGHDFRMGPGGKGSNQAVAAHRAGADVTLVTKLGKDMMGTIATDFYKKEGMSQEYVFMDEEEQTGIALISVEDRTVQNTIIVIPGACNSITKPALGVEIGECRRGSRLAAAFETLAPERNLQRVDGDAQRGVGREILGESGVEREHHSALRAEKFVDSACGNDHVG